MIPKEIHPVTHCGVLEVPADLNGFGRAQSQQFISQALRTGRDWLQIAVKGNDPRPIAELRSWAMNVAEQVRIKNLGSESELNIKELARRSERALGIVVRQAKEDGLTDTGMEYFSSKGQRTQIYTQVEGLTDDMYEQLLNTCRSEGSMTLRNVMRVARKMVPLPTSMDRVRDITKYSQQGFTEEQIADKLGISVGHVRDLVGTHKISTVNRRLGKTGSTVDPNRIVGRIVGELETALPLVEYIDWSRLDPTKVAGWVDSLTASLQDLKRFRNTLTKEIPNGSN